MSLKELALVVAFVAGAVGSGGAQTDSDPRWNYFAVRSRLIVTIKQDGAELATLTFPASTFVSVSDGTATSQRNAFHGNVEVRGRLKSEKTTGSAADIMRNAPLILKATDVNVQVKND
jgi:hypothetical protein